MNTSYAKVGTYSLDPAFELIKEFEGFEPVAYQCPAGYWTVGYGQKDGVTRGMTVTKEEALAMVAARFNSDLNKLRRWEQIWELNLHRVEVNALLSWMYNFSYEKFEKSTLNIAIREYNKICQLYEKRTQPEEEPVMNRMLSAREKVEFEWMRWDKARIDGVLQPVNGLIRRRKAEFRVFASGLEIRMMNKRTKTTVESNSQSNTTTEPTQQSALQNLAEAVAQMETRLQRLEMGMLTGFGRVQQHSPNKMEPELYESKQEIAPVTQSTSKTNS